MPPPPQQFHPFNPVAYRHYLSELGTPPAARKVKIIDGAQALPQGRTPVALAEVMAHLAAVAVSSDPASYLTAHGPRFAQPRLVEEGGVRAVLCEFEGCGVLVFEGRALAGPVSQLAAVLTPYAGPRLYVPDDTVWDATPRVRPYARAFAQVRDQIETWAKTIPQKGEEPPAFLFAGHGIGGALAQLAAYEFVKRGRPIAALVTFGAPCAGGKAFLARMPGAGPRRAHARHPIGARRASRPPAPVRAGADRCAWQLAERPLSGREDQAAEQIGTTVADYAVTVVET